MIDKTPYVYISKDHNELQRLVKGDLSISNVSEDSFLFRPELNNNLISIEDTFMNDQYRITLKFVDSDGVFESTFLNAKTVMKSEDQASYILKKSSYFITYGIGNEYNNRSPIQSVTLIEAFIDVSNGRVITLVFAEYKDAERGYSLATPFSYNQSRETGISDQFSRYTMNPRVEKNNKNRYSPEDSILDAMIDLLKKEYNTKNILLILPSLVDYFPLFLNPDINLVNTKEWSSFDNLIKSIGLTRIQGSSLEGHQLGGFGLALEHRAQAEGIPTSINTNTFAQSYDTDPSFYRIRADPSFAGTTASIVSQINRLSGTNPTIKWSVRTETNYALANLFLDHLAKSPMLGGSYQVGSLSKSDPLVICGDQDLIDRYLYSVGTRETDGKRLRPDFSATLYRLTRSEEYRNARFQIFNLDESLINFDSSTNPILGKPRKLDINYKPTFRFGGTQPNLTEFAVQENPSYLLAVSQQISDSFQGEDIAKIFEIIQEKGHRVNRVIKTLESYIDEGQVDLNSIQRVIRDAASENISRRLAKDLIDVVYRSHVLKKSLPRIEEAKDLDPLALIKKLSKTTDFLNSLSKYVYQVTVKSLPFFLRSTRTSFNTKVFLQVTEPPITGGSQSSELPGSNFYNGDYQIVGYRHVINNTSMFSEFKLLRNNGLLSIIDSLAQTETTAQDTGSMRDSQRVEDEMKMLKGKAW